MNTSGNERIEYDPRLGGFGPRGMPCLRCGTCCTKWQPPVDSSEIESIALGLNMAPADFRREYTQPYPMRRDQYLIRRCEVSCVFLRFEGEKAACAIHTSRPEACRNWTPGLARRECRQGLIKRLSAGAPPAELFSSPEDRTAFLDCLKPNREG